MFYVIFIKCVGIYTLRSILYMCIGIEWNYFYNYWWFLDYDLSFIFSKILGHADVLWQLRFKIESTL